MIVRLNGILITSGHNDNAVIALPTACAGKKVSWLRGNFVQMAKSTPDSVIHAIINNYEKHLFTDGDLKKNTSVNACVGDNGDMYIVNNNLKIVYNDETVSHKVAYSVILAVTD